MACWGKRPLTKRYNILLCLIEMNTQHLNQAEELEDLLTLSTFCSGAITMPIIDLISSTIADSQGAHAARMIGLSMQTVAKREPTEWSDKINLGLWTKRCVEKWHSSYEVLEGLVALANAKYVSYNHYLLCNIDVSASFLAQQLARYLSLKFIPQYILPLYHIHELFVWQLSDFSTLNLLTQNMTKLKFSRGVCKVKK